MGSSRDCYDEYESPAPKKSEKISIASHELGQIRAYFNVLGIKKPILIEAMKYLQEYKELVVEKEGKSK